MTTESIIGITSGILGIATVIWGIAYHFYNLYKQLPLTELMNQLVDTKLSTKGHQKILKKMNRQLRGLGINIKTEYIQNFVLNERGKEAVFKDLCDQNNIEPTKEICKKLLGADSRQAREYYHRKRGQSHSTQEKMPIVKPDVAHASPTNNEGQTVYMSKLLMERHPQTCKNLLAILDKHHINYAFLKGTKDIWCRDYMPVQLESGKLIQFEYNPSYLRTKKWEATRSDVDLIHEQNNIQAQSSNINLDGGNVLICDGRAILSDRIYDENPNYKNKKEELRKRLAQLLECEVIIIPSLNKTIDFTGHADGMVRFVNRNTVLGIWYDDKYKKDWQKNMQKVLDTYNLAFTKMPFFEPEPNLNHPDSAIGVYVNYLEVNNIIVVPVFGRKKEDDEAVAILQKAFPNKKIEKINYNDVALEGGLLNCTTWVVKKKQ